MRKKPLIKLGNVTRLVAAEWGRRSRPKSRARSKFVQAAVAWIKHRPKHVPTPAKFSAPVADVKKMRASWMENIRLLTQAFAERPRSVFKNPINSYADGTGQTLVGLRMVGQRVEIVVQRRGEAVQFCPSIAKAELRKALRKSSGTFSIFPAFEWVFLGQPPLLGATPSPRSKRVASRGSPA